jgi:hypothetical protein
MARIWLTKWCSARAWPARCTAELWAGIWNRPSWLWLPSFASKWLAMTNTSLPLNSNSPTIGLRLAVHTGLPDQMRAALLRAGRPARDYMQS